MPYFDLLFVKPTARPMIRAKSTTMIATKTHRNMFLFMPKYLLCAGNLLSNFSAKGERVVGGAFVAARGSGWWAETSDPDILTDSACAERGAWNSVDVRSRSDSRSSFLTSSGRCISEGRGLRWILLMVETVIERVWVLRSGGCSEEEVTNKEMC
jgi:hypothetical protein